MLLITPLHYNRIKFDDPETYPPRSVPVIRYSLHADMPVYELVWNDGNNTWFSLCSHCIMAMIEGDTWCEIPQLPGPKKRENRR